MTRAIAPEDLFRFRFVVAADLSPDGTRVVFAQTRIAPGEEEDDDEVEHSRPASPRRRERRSPAADVQRLHEFGAGDLARRIERGIHVDADGEAAALAAPAGRRRAAQADGSRSGRRRRPRLVAGREQDRVHGRPAGRAAQARAPLSRRPNGVALRRDRGDRRCRPGRLRPRRHRPRRRAAPADRGPFHQFAAEVECRRAVARLRRITRPRFARAHVEAAARRSRGRGHRPHGA